MRHKFTACVTHDIDSLKYKPRYRIRGFIKTGSFKPFSPSFNPCRAFDECIEIERKAGAKSTFFFLDYDGDSLRSVADAGCEIALHAEAKTIEDAGALRAAKQSLEDKAGARVYGLRQHRYPSVKMNFEKAWRNAKQAGFDYDSSVGAHEIVLKQPFTPLRGLAELPVNVMDATLMYRKRFTPEQALDETKRAVDFVARRRGVFVFLTHLNNVFDDYNLSGWRGYFEDVLAYCKEKKAVFKTCAQAAASFAETKRLKKRTR